MSLHQELLSLLDEKIRDSGRELDDPLGDDTALLSSGLITSLHLLELAGWIEEQIEGEIDLTSIDPRKDWDTPRQIFEFIDRRR